MKCPYVEICVTPNLDKTNPHVKNVCMAEVYKDCTHFQFAMWPEKDSEDWNRAKNWIKDKLEGKI